MIKPVAFAGVYKLNTSYDNLIRVRNYINDNYEKHQAGYPVSNGKEFIFRNVDAKHQVVAVSCGDYENYLLTGYHAKDAEKYRSQMMDACEGYYSYYGADDLADIASEIAAATFQERLRAIIDDARDTGIIKEIALRNNPKKYDSSTPPKFFIIG